MDLDMPFAKLGIALIRQSEAPEMFCHPFQGRTGKNHRFLEFRNRQIRVGAHHFGKRRFRLFDMASSYQR